jgi:CrcB protein
MFDALVVSLGAAIGAPLRYYIDQILKRRHHHWLPLETLLINVLGSFILGLVINAKGHTPLLLGTGFAGAFTTWSTLAVEYHAISQKNHRRAMHYLTLTLILGIGAAALGIYLAK